MAIPKRYHSQSAEVRILQDWQEHGIYRFEQESRGEVFSIDTPPATVSGTLHLGHTYSYSHPDFMARFFRMNGCRVFYPMGFDDNGLPTDRLVEKLFGITARQVGRQAYIEKCLETGERAAQEYKSLWQRLGLSVDWQHTYRTSDARSRRIAQWSFIDLHRKSLVYQQEAPTIWCPECQTGIAQADLDDIERQTEFITLPFSLVEDGQSGSEFIPIATTRPELLPACVAVFIHPDDRQNRHLIGRSCVVPFFNQQVPIMSDPAVDPDKGTGIVMCCTFGDSIDVSWWNQHNLPLVPVIDESGRLTQAAGQLAGLTIQQARQEITGLLQSAQLISETRRTEQSVRVHERCDTPVEYIVTRQWFINLLDHTGDFLGIGEKVNWHPEHMHSRYRDWVENLNWDWCISRQRVFGVAFPVWYCAECGNVVLAAVDQLPVDPQVEQPAQPCSCGSMSFTPERDVMDTWATSSLTPQIAGRWRAPAEEQAAAPDADGLYPVVTPYNLRPQAHEIIRTWAFYTIVKSHFHFNEIPWSDVLISGWGIAGEGMGKISKSRGGGPLAPMDMIERYSADAVRYWAASTAPGRDSVISEEKIQQGARLVNNLWNVARFCERFLLDYREPAGLPDSQLLTPADRWMLSKTQRLIENSTRQFNNYDYSAAKNAIEELFWRDLADNYLEMCKQRLYDDRDPTRVGALFTLNHTLLVLLKLFAPLLPFITEAVYQGLYTGRISAEPGGYKSIHLAKWPQPNPALVSEKDLQFGELLVELATAVRRYKSEKNLPLGIGLKTLAIEAGQLNTQDLFHQSRSDIESITRAKEIVIGMRQVSSGKVILERDGICISLIE